MHGRRKCEEKLEKKKRVGVGNSMFWRGSGTFQGGFLLTGGGGQVASCRCAKGECK